jgi:hypothetical protein
MKAQKNGRPPGSHNIDELFSSALGKLGKEPSPTVWKNITEQLHPLPFSPGGLIGSINKWFFIGLAGIAITIAVLFFQSRQSTIKQLANTSIVLPGVTSTVISPSKITDAAKSYTKAIISERSEAYSATVHPVKPNEPKNIISAEQNPITIKTEKQTATQPDNVNQSTLRPIDSELTTNKSSDFGIFESTMTTKSSNVEIPESTTTANISNAGISQLENPASKKSILNNPADIDTTGQSASTIPEAGQDGDTMKNIPTPQTPDIPNVEDALPLTYSLELYAEPALTGQVLKARLSDANALLDYRRVSENSFLGMNWGLEGRVSRKKIFAQVGIRYSVFGLNADYPFTITNVDSSRSHYEVNIQNEWIQHTVWVWSQNSGVVYYIPARDSNLIQHIDSTWKSLIDTSINKRNEVSQNRFRYVEIPILIGYQFGSGKIVTELSGGIALGFLSKMKGNIIDYNLNATIPANEQNIPFNKPLLSLLLRLGCSYQLNNNYSVFTRSAFRYTPRSAFGTSYPLYQRYYSGGLQFGIRYTF